MPSRRRGLSFLALVTVVAAGCARIEVSSPLPEYMRALAAAAEETVDPASRFVPPAYPDASQRRLPEADIRIGVGRFLDLKTCGLRRLVAERNSALGRMESDGIRLVYEHALLTGLARCLAMLEQSGDEPALAEAIEDALRAKQAAAGGTLWNATLGSPELAGAYRVSGPALDPTRPDPEPVAALRGLAAAARGFGRPDVLLERNAHVGNLRVLERSGHGGRLAKALGRATENLRQASRHVRAVPCDGGRRDDLDTARQRFEHGDVGRWLEALVESARQWHQALDDLLAAQRASPPPEFLRYHAQVMDTDNAQGLGPALLAAIAEHRTAWRDADACSATEG